jgi:DHA2 family multidrug resistance protein
MLKVFAIYTIVFTQMLDTTVANLSLSNIATSLYIDVYHSGWIMTSFGTGLVISFSLGNLLGKVYSNDSVLVIGVIAFVIASLGCGLSTSEIEFLIWRFVQGLGSGIAVVVSQSHLLRILGESRRTLALSLWASAFSLAPVIGPIVGAIITEHLSWRWLFLINVPLMAGSLLILLPAFSLTRAEKVQTRLPFLTLFTFAALVASTQYVLDFGEQLGWLDAPSILSAMVISAISLIAFIKANNRNQLFNFNVFRDINYAVATSISFLGNGLLFASLVFLPIWMQRDYNMPIFEAGLIVSVASGVAAILTPFLGKYLASRWFGIAAIFSLSITSISFVLMSRFSLEVSTDYMIFSRVIAGLGLATFTLPLAALALKNIDASNMVNANAIGLMLRVVFANVFVAVGFTAFNHIRRFKELDFLSTPDRLTILKYHAGVPDGVSSYLSHYFSTGALTNMFLFSAIAFALFAIVVTPVVVRISR